jgi:hypothetical protein
VHDYQLPVVWFINSRETYVDGGVLFLTRDFGLVAHCNGNGGKQCNGQNYGHKHQRTYHTLPPSGHCHLQKINIGRSEAIGRKNVLCLWKNLRKLIQHHGKIG